MDLGSRKLGSNRCGTFSMISCNYSVDCNVRHGVTLRLMTFKFDTFGLWRWILQLPTCVNSAQKCGNFMRKLTTPFAAGTFFTEAFISLDDHSVVALRTSKVWPTKTWHIASGITWKLQNMEIHGNPMRCQFSCCPSYLDWPPHSPLHPAPRASEALCSARGSGGYKCRESCCESAWFR